MDETLFPFDFGGTGMGAADPWSGVFSPRNHFKMPLMLGCSQLRTLSGCNNCRSRASRPGTNPSWE